MDWPAALLLVTEGVETIEQAEVLQGLGWCWLRATCSAALSPSTDPPGYLLIKPLSFSHVFATSAGSSPSLSTLALRSVMVLSSSFLATGSM